MKKQTITGKVPRKKSRLGVKPTMVERGMTTETVLTEKQKSDLIWTYEIGLTVIKAVERAVLESPEVQALRKDAERYRHIRGECDMSDCNAVQFSDQMTCSCGNVWDMNDPYPPECKTEPAMLAAAPAVQSEPVAWYLPSEEGYDSRFRDHATVKACTDNSWAGWQPLYTAQQPESGVSALVEALQAELERERQRRFDGNEMASREHREDVAGLVDALERIASWPDGGNQYGQQNIKMFAAKTLDAHRKQGGGE